MTKSILWLSAISTLLSVTSCQKSANSNAEEPVNDSLMLVVGTSMDDNEEAVRVYRVSSSDMGSRQISSLSGISQPTFMCISKDRKRIYAVGEKSEIEDATANSIEFDDRTGKMRIMNTQLTMGGNPCYISLTPDESAVLTANYMGGNISKFELRKDGTLDTAQVFLFEGKGTDEKRQTKPYLHCISYTPDGKYMLGDDLGTDSVHVISLNSWKRCESAYIAPAAGPRHICWAPDGKHAYLIGELSDEVYVLSYENEKLNVIQSVQADSVHASGSADIHITSDGTYLYASHRLKMDGISIFKVDMESGMIRKIGYQTCGSHPRNFTLTPDERFLLVACRDSDQIEIYERNTETGMLKDTGRRIEIKGPMFLMFVPKN